MILTEIAKKRLILFSLWAVYALINIIENRIIFSWSSEGVTTYYESVVEEPQNLLLTPFILLSKLLGLSSVMSLPLFFIFWGTLVAISMFFFTNFLLTDTSKGMKDSGTLIISSFIAGLVYSQYPWAVVGDIFLPFTLMKFALPLYLLSLYHSIRRQSAMHSIIASLIPSLFFTITYDSRIPIYLFILGVVCILIPMLVLEGNSFPRVLAIYLIHVVAMIGFNYTNILGVVSFVTGGGGIVIFVKDTFLYYDSTFLNLLLGRAFLSWVYNGFENAPFFNVLDAMSLLVPIMALIPLLSLTRYKRPQRIMVLAYSSLLVLTLFLFGSPRYGEDNVFLKVIFSSFLAPIFSESKFLAGLAFEFRAPRFADLSMALSFSMLISFFSFYALAFARRRYST